MSDKPVIATELLEGQGLGNRLFAYVSIRSLAYLNGYDFCILNGELLADSHHMGSGAYFMDIDCGLDMPKEAFDNIYYEREDRLFIGNSKHDIKNGCYITGADDKLLDLDRSALIYGNLQDEKYFRQCRDEIKKWLAVKPEYDCMDYARENLCVINVRGGEYAGNPELFLRRRYWLDAMEKMRELRSDMEFMVVTDDVAAAGRVLPEVEAHHFELSKDYTVIKNASYLILSNSSFAFFPAYTSDRAKYIIAPKYWARHNVSDGYWASEQNIYDGFNYMDRKGRLFTADECRDELARYKRKSEKYRRIGKPLQGAGLLMAKARVLKIVGFSWVIRACRSIRKRVGGFICRKN